MSAVRRRLADRAERRAVARRGRPGSPDGLWPLLVIVPTMLALSLAGAAGIVAALRWWLGA